MSTFTKRMLLALFMAGIFSGSNVFAKKITKEELKEKVKNLKNLGKRQQFSIVMFYVKNPGLFAQTNVTPEYLFEQVDDDVFKRKDKEGKTPLDLALEIFRVSSSGLAEGDPRVEPFFKTVKFIFKYAEAEQQFNFLKKLIDGAPLPLSYIDSFIKVTDPKVFNIIDSNEQNLLHWAVARGYLPWVRIIVENGGAGLINKKDIIELTPLELAEYYLNKSSDQLSKEKYKLILNFLQSHAG